MQANELVLPSGRLLDGVAAEAVLPGVAEGVVAGGADTEERVGLPGTCVGVDRLGDKSGDGDGVVDGEAGKLEPELGIDEGVTGDEVVSGGAAGADEGGVDKIVPMA